MNDAKSQQWLEEYNEFLKGEKSVPQEVSNQIYATIRNLLNPSPFLIFTKVLGIHLAVGTLSLAICHQFGLNPFGTEKSLADWFMRVGGHGFCMISCGILFTSLSILMAGYFLTSDEARVLRKTKLLQALSLSLLSLGVFAFMGADLALALSGLWLLGGLIGGGVATEVIWKFKFEFNSVQ